MATIDGSACWTSAEMAFDGVDVTGWPAGAGDAAAAVVTGAGAAVPPSSCTATATMPPATSAPTRAPDRDAAEEPTAGRRRRSVTRRRRTTPRPTRRRWRPRGRWGGRRRRGWEHGAAGTWWRRATVGARPRTTDVRYVLSIGAVGPGALRAASCSDLLTHEGGVGGGEQHDRPGDEHDDLPPRQQQALVERAGWSGGPRCRRCSTTMPVDCRDGLRRTPVASLYSWSGENRRTFSSVRALASTSSVVESAFTSCAESATMPAIRPANRVSTSQTAIAASAAVAARRQTTDSSSDRASHSAMYTSGDDVEGDDPGHVAERRAHAEPQRAVAGDHRDQAGQGEGDGAEAGDELAVDDLVAVDRLGRRAGAACAGPARR